MSNNPDVNEWVLLKIVDAEESIIKHDIVIGKEIVEKDIPRIKLHLSPVSRHYKKNIYWLYLLMGNPVVAHHEVNRNRRPDELGCQNLNEQHLRDALEISTTEALNVADMPGKNVMGQCFHVVRSFMQETKTFAQFQNHLAHPDGVQIPVTKNGKTIIGRALWESAREALFAKPGTKVRTILPGGQQITAIRVQDEWHDIND